MRNRGCSAGCSPDYVVFVITVIRKNRKVSPSFHPTMRKSGARHHPKMRNTGAYLGTPASGTAMPFT
jgi:hypothetical protein